MFKLDFDEQKKNFGMDPGSVNNLVNTDGTAEFSAYKYNLQNLDIENKFDPKELEKLNLDDQVIWLNFSGIPCEHQVEFLEKENGIDPINLEDILTTNHRPKLEEWHDYLFLVSRIPFIKEGELQTKQFSLILKENILITFIEDGEDNFLDVKKKLLNANSMLRNSKEDYLFYLLLDNVVDQYFQTLDLINSRYEQLTHKIDNDTSPELIREIQNLKHEILNLRRDIQPIKEFSLKLQRADLKIIAADTKEYLRDLFDHAHHVSEATEMLREMTNSLLELSHSTLSNKMNEVMKVLTIISTIFIPITFIAGIYGMNFENMPELKFENGYFVAVGIMLVISTVMVLYFKKKKWL